MVVKDEAMTGACHTPGGVVAWEIFPSAVLLVQDAISLSSLLAHVQRQVPSWALF